MASTAARFADTHVKVGLLPGWGGSARLIRCVGLMRAKELALTARRISAAEGQQLGFVHSVYDPEALGELKQAKTIDPSLKLSPIGTGSGAALE